MLWGSNKYEMFCKQEPGRGIPVFVPSEEGGQARSSGYPEMGIVIRKTKVHICYFHWFFLSYYSFLSLVLAYVSSLIFTNLTLKSAFVVMQQSYKRIKTHKAFGICAGV